MTQTLTAPTRRRWRDLPQAVQHTVADKLGSTVKAAADQTGGFTDGIAARLTLTDGRRAFCKAIPSTDPLADAYRREARCAARLPDRVPSPRLLAATEYDGYLISLFDDIDGRHPQLDRPDDLRAVLALTATLADTLTPTPDTDAPPVAQDLAPIFGEWRTFTITGPPADLHPWARQHLDRLAALEQLWPSLARGDTLCHADLRPDNMLLTKDGHVLAVDWACACLGAPWLDLVLLLGSVPLALTDADAILTSHHLTNKIDPTAITAVLCALSGCWEAQSRLPAEPTSPHLRSFQARNATHVRDWLRYRTGWSA